MPPHPYCLWMVCRKESAEFHFFINQEAQLQWFHFVPFSIKYVQRQVRYLFHLQSSTWIDKYVDRHPIMTIIPEGKNRLKWVTILYCSAHIADTCHSCYNRRCCTFSSRWAFFLRAHFVANLLTCWCTFTGLNNAVVSQNWQISGTSAYFLS